MSSDEPEEDVGPLRAWLAAPAIANPIADGTTSGAPAFGGERVADRAPSGSHPWLPRGPENVGGRVRALAADPELVGGRPRALYAGAASGGVFRSLDDGLSWHSIWEHGMPTASIGAIVVGRHGGNRYVWVATGEKGRLDGNGVFRLTLAAGADEPIAWERMGTADAMKGTGERPVYLEAAAVDPDDGRVCWFVGPTGIYRFKDGAWTTLRIPAGGNRTGAGASDVKFMSTPHGRYVVVVADDSLVGDVYLITTPDAGAAALQAALAAATTTTPSAGADLATPLQPAAPPPPTLRARNGKVAVVAGGSAADPDRVYVAYGTTRTVEPEEPLLALCTATISHGGAPSRPRWDTRLTWTSRYALGAAGFPDGQGQSTYNLVLAARARAPSSAATDVVVLGMVDLGISTDGGATFPPPGRWTGRYYSGRFGYHADQHAVVMETGRARLWIGNDGGVACTDGAFDAAGALVASEHAGWRRRVAGLVAGQVYDLSQHPLSDAAQIALQDLGAWKNTGSTSWRFVLWGDGLAIAPDPHDPYRTIASSQEQCYELRFDGELMLANTPVAGRRALTRGILAGRELSVGLVPGDKGAFEDTVVHPHVPGHILHLRRKRLYQARDGETWRVVPVGDRLELQFQLAFSGFPPLAPGTAGLMVRVAGNAALGLGFLPGETSQFVETTTVSRTFVVSLLSARPAPAVAANHALELTLEVVGPAGRFVATRSVVFPAAEDGYQAILDRLVTALAAPLGADWRPLGAPAATPPAALVGATVTMRALPAFTGDGGLVEVVGDTVGADRELYLDGDVLGAGAFRGEAGRPPVITMPNPMAMTAGRRLTLVERRAGPAPADAQREPGAATLRINDFMARWSAFYGNGRPLAGRLERARQSGNGAYAVWYAAGKKSVRLRPGRNGGALVAAAVTGTAAPRLFPVVPAVAALTLDLTPAAQARTFDLSGLAPPVRLTLTVGAVVHNIDFVAADFVGGLARATPEELRRKIESVLAAAAPPGNDWLAEIQRELEGSGPSEVAYSPVDPRVIWVGGRNLLFVTTDGGDHWRNVFPSPVPTVDDFNLLENRLSVESIAPDPFPPADPARPEHTALVGTLGDLVFATSTVAEREFVARTVPPAPSGFSGTVRTFALLGDPGRRNVYYAATDLGVYRSDNGGGSWSTLSVGLPHAPCLDLAIDPGLDTLRVAVFGRGLYEKYLGEATLTLPDVHFHASPRDAARRPLAHGPDLGVDAPAWVDGVHSPDLCLTSLPAADRQLLDINELESVRHEVARPGVDLHLLIRAHNRSALPVADARVIALWAPVEGSVPELPASLWTAMAAGPVAAAAAHGAWRALGTAAVPSISPGGARLVALPIRWDANLDRRDRVALVAIVVRGTAAPTSGAVDPTSLVLRDPRVALRLTPVRVDDGFVTLRLIGPATGTVAGLRITGIASAVVPAAPLAATALQFAAPAGPGPQSVRSTAPGPFDVRNLVLTLSYHETLVTQQPTYTPPAAVPAPVPVTTLRDPAAADRVFPIDFREASLANPAAATAAQVRAFIASQLRRLSRLLVVEDATVALSLQRSPTDLRPRRGGASWQGGALVVTAAGTAATDADFAPAALAAPAQVAIGTAQRFTVRVWNPGELDVTAADTIVRMFWLDPHTDAPDPHPLGAAAGQGVAIAAGQHADVFVEDTIAAISHDDVLILVEIDHPADHPPARTFPDWGAVRRWGADSDNTLGRLLRRR